MVIKKDPRLRGDDNTGSRLPRLYEARNDN